MHTLPHRKSLLTSAIALSLVSFISSADTRFDEIVVNATKLDTPLSEVNNSVVVKTAEQLEKANVYDVVDLEKVFPGLVIQTRGNRTYANSTVRGISSPDYYSPTVSVYVDGVLQDTAFLSQPLINVERVELLRGPQGTLYGGNAQGGIINIVTHKAVGSAQGNTSVLYSSLSRQVDAVAALPISESLTTDISARYLHDLGDIDYATTSKNDANDANERSLTARIHYQPTDSALSATLSVSANKLHSHEEWYLSEQEYDEGETTTPIPLLERDIYSYALNLGYDFGLAQLTSITAYQNREIEREYAFGIWEENQNKFSQELRLKNHVSEQLSTLLGGYYERRDLNVDTGTGRNQLDYRTFALFGQGHYLVTQHIDVTVGARASRVDVESDYSGSVRGIAPFNDTLTETTISPKAAIGWQVDDDTRLYASIASGYRPGGYNVVPLSNQDAKGYEAESSVNAELGWRISSLDHAFEFSGALYWITTEDVQIYTGTPGNQSLSNVEEALSKGIEAELTVYPTPSLTLTLGGTYGRSTFESDNGDLKGNRLPYAPDVTTTFGVDYTLPQTLIEGDVSLASHARYTSKTYFDESNLLSQSGYTLVDLSLNYDVTPDLNIALFGNNITDKTYVTYSYAYHGTYSNYGKGREIGLKMRYDW